mmetsp:Transcript_70514/g.122382  ORF Transcript_70514/g.122382 Transcript_70514/m.122382 type:complete len:88 (+) Transcript_70514:20-283(+)
MHRPGGAILRSSTVIIACLSLPGGRTGARAWIVSATVRSKIFAEESCAHREQLRPAASNRAMQLLFKQDMSEHASKVHLCIWRIIFY